MSSPAMPIKLLVVLVLLCLNLAANLYNLSGALAGTAYYVRIGLNIALLVGLLRGQEWARMLAKVTAVLSLVAGGILLLQVMVLGAALGASSLGLYLYGMVALAVVYGGFLLWCMNQQDVQAWLMSRTMRE